MAARRIRIGMGVFAVGLAVFAAPVAAADPATPADPVQIAPAPAAAPVSPAAATAPESAPASAAAPEAAAVPAITPADGAQHLPSPDSLPPGTTQEAPSHPTVGFLRDIWHALRSGEVSGTDALMLLGTRPVDPNKLSASKPSNQGVPTDQVAADAAPPGAPDAGPAPAAPAAPAG